MLKKKMSACTYDLFDYQFIIICDGWGMRANLLGCVCLEVKYGEWKTLKRKWKKKNFLECV